MDDQNYQNYVEATPVVPQQTMHPLVGLWSLIIGLILLIFVIAGIFAARNDFVAGAAVMVKILVGLIVVLVPSGLIVGIVAAVQNHQRKVKVQELEIERAQKAIQREDELHQVEIDERRARAEVLRRTINFDDQGNAALFDPYTQQFIQLRGQMREFPNLTSYHHSPRITGITEQKEQTQLPPASVNIALPKIETFYDLIPFNSLQTALGIEAETGKPILAPIRKSTHFKLIGGSGQGKSCVAASILDIATTTNDPDHLRIGLLDLEHNTSRLFEDLPHIAEIGPKRQRLVGRDPDEVAQKLKLLQWELTRRAQLGEEYCTQHEPVMLVYVEEMLALKYEVVDEKLKKEMLASLNVIAIRGRKYGIFFLACMQTDYSDKSTREAMAQFRTRGGFAIDPDTARASGFFSTELIKQNFAAGRAGQFVLEKPQFSAIALAPDYDVKVKLEMLSSSTSPVTSNRQVIPFAVRGPHIVSELDEGAIEGDGEVVTTEPLREFLQASLSSFSAQEQRIIRKFFQDGMGIGQIVSSEFTNARGEPLTSGEAYKNRSKEVQDIIRAYVGKEKVV